MRSPPCSAISSSILRRPPGRGTPRATARGPATRRGATGCQRGSFDAFSSSIGMYSFEWRSHSATSSTTTTGRPCAAASGSAVWYGAPQRAGVHGVELLARQVLGEVLRLRQAGLGQLGIGGAASSLAAHGQAVANQQQLHAHRLAGLNGDHGVTHEDRCHPGPGERVAGGARPVLLAGVDVVRLNLSTARSTSTSPGCTPCAPRPSAPAWSSGCSPTCPDRRCAPGSCPPTACVLLAGHAVALRAGRRPTATAHVFHVDYPTLLARPACRRPGA